MARERVIRNRVSPRAAFVEQVQEPVAAFLNRAGVLFFGTEWTPDVLETLKHQSAHIAPGSNADLASVVRDQLIAGLRSRRLTAIVRLVAAAWAHVRLDVFEDGWDKLSDDERAEVLARPSDDPLMGEDGTPKQRTFVVSADFWSMPESNKSIDWATSNVTIPTKHLRDEGAVLRRDQSISDFYDVQTVVRDFPLSIRYPLRALRDLIKYEELPDEKWFQRYKIYRVDGRMEALAAMWRYLAIGGFTATDLPSAADLARRADEYLSGQGLLSSQEVRLARNRNSGLEEMAGLILDQFRDGNLSSSVLVSGNPRNRRPA